MNEGTRTLATLLERLLTASRWLLAPFFVGLALGIVILLIKFVRAFHLLSDRLNGEIKRAGGEAAPASPAVRSAAEA